MAKAWDDVKRTAQSAFHVVANSYQDILIRGHLMPNRNIERDVAEEEYQFDIVSRLKARPCGSGVRAR